jgi:cobalt-zinc-cadmium efflux system membrane fusion protein
VIANAPEDDLPTLLELPPERRFWTVRTVGAPDKGGIRGPIDDISYLIDINQHTAVVKGHIDNPKLKDRSRDERSRILRGGQFISATVELPAPKGVVEVPVSAIVDDGKQCVVFIQPDPSRPLYTMRRVQVTHRFEKTVFIRSRPFDKDKGEDITPEEREEGLLPRQPLRKGERVLTSGVLELKKELEDRESRAEKRS